MAVRPVFLFLFISLLTQVVRAQQPAVFAPEGRAIRGYDPVAYFTDGKPLPGNPSLRYDWQGSTWTFASAKNRDAFRANPARYAPQYGGYCAYGVSRGYKAPIDPEVWTISEGKLYLNYSLKVRQDWDRDRTGHIRKADQNWPQVKVK
jgi:YHS domain-containing protein